MSVNASFAHGKDLTYGNDTQIDRVCSLDPLGADHICLDLRAMNAAKDLAAMISAFRDLLPSCKTIDAYNIDESIAAMRDLGMFLGSIKRHGVEPLEVVPEATSTLKVLGARTNMIPRDTVHHYCTWNPRGGRSRMYTGDKQEALLQDAVRRVFPHLRAGLELCHLIDNYHPSDPKFAILVDALNGELQPMVESISSVVDKVSPAFFTRVLRPYFEEIVVDNRTYLGPAAAQVPLWLIDEAVWASDRSERAYQDFLRHSVPYSLPRWRELHEMWAYQPSMVTRLIKAHSDDPESVEWFAPSLCASAVALARMLRTVSVFRGRHLGIARQAYREELRLYRLGSGGASVDLLRDILDLTRESVQLTKNYSKRPPVPVMLGAAGVRA